MQGRHRLPRRRRRGVSVKPLRKQLAQAMPNLFKTSGDSDARVRECACFVLGQISEHCQPEVLA